MKTIFNKGLIEKYDKPGPRYTSYPPATEFNESVGKEDYKRKLLESNQGKRPLSLYIHIPFCESACWFCGCNVIISHRKDVSRRYLDYLYREMELLGRYLDKSRKVVQIHWGGGTPNFLTVEEMRELFSKIKENFSVDEEAEISVEIDPRYLSDGQLETLRQLGFNRVSMGLQDLDEEVQRAINRIQPESLMRDVMKQLRDLGFKSINIDLIYGLPYQTPEKFRRTIEKTIGLDPDRVAVYNFAYVPWLKPLQRRIDPSTLPPPEDKLTILEMTIPHVPIGGLSLHWHGPLCQARGRAGNSPKGRKPLEELSGLHYQKGRGSDRHRCHIHWHVLRCILSKLQDPEGVLFGVRQWRFCHHEGLFAGTGGPSQKGGNYGFDVQL
jgi:coproporphyrinogen III oxidase, anaerobic (EC 1.3.99.22)